MTCWHNTFDSETHETAFSIDPTSISFGPGVLREVGESLAGSKRVALFTDAQVGKLPMLETVRESLKKAGIDFELYANVHVEPTNASFEEAARFARDGKFDSFVSLGGGSVIDTCKAAALLSSCEGGLMAYVNAPVGEGRVVPRELPRHIACPTTCGTGSECTGIAVFDHLELKVKTGIASRRLRPTRALIDPTATEFLPRMVVAASAFDVLSHALESYTARPFSSRAKPVNAARPMSQGRNPWSDVGSLEALRLAGKFLVRAVHDASDFEARSQLSWAATLAGVAFGNSGVHLPHAMSYAVAGLVKSYRCEGYPGDEPLVPHGISVVVNAPSVFRATASSSPERHAEAARALGASLEADAPLAEVVATLSGTLTRLMRDAGIPNGLSALGYEDEDVPALTKGTLLQKRLLDNAPVPVDEALMSSLFRGAQRCW
ncbi:MAG: iron-containing alcohol dehydrogenase [Archangium sp.]|nr:iron-containing alcohol dehydrogenase [Archangium sp.]